MNRVNKTLIILLTAMLSSCAIETNVSISLTSEINMNHSSKENLSTDFVASSPINSTNTISSKTENPVKVFENIDSIPKVYINMSTWIDSKEYKPTTISIVDDIHPENNIEFVTAQTKIRGNSTSSYDYVKGKWSYKIKFDDKIDLFNMGKHKKWNLLANYMDRSGVRNYLSLEFARNMQGLNDFQAESKFVEVYTNDGVESYRGTYLLTESVEVNKNRLNIETDYTPNATEIPFMLELNAKMGWDNGINRGITYFQLYDSGNDLCFETRYPETLTQITPTQVSYITNCISKLYFAAANASYDDEWKNLIDIDSFIDYFIVKELFFDPDLGHASFYLYKPLGGKIKAGPIWDMDLTMGNYSTNNMNYAPSGFVNKYGEVNTLYNYLMASPEFLSAYIKRYDEIYLNGLNELERGIISVRDNELLSAALTRNNAKWKTWGNKVFDLANNPNNYKFTTYYDQVNYILKYLITGLETTENDFDYIKENYFGRADWIYANIINYNTLVVR